MANPLLGYGSTHSPRAVSPSSSLTLEDMQVTSQCRVDAPIEWVRTFLLAGTREDDVTVDGDTIEVRNTLSANAEGGTVLDVDANLRLLGLARVVGGVFRGRVRRTLQRGLDRLPVAIEQALDAQDRAEEDEDESGALQSEGGQPR
jgi:hypothetical protein